MIRTAYLARLERRGEDRNLLTPELNFSQPPDSTMPLQKLGEFTGDNPALANILGLPGVIASTDKVMASRIELAPGGNVRPFYAEYRDSKSFIVRPYLSANTG